MKKDKELNTYQKVFKSWKNQIKAFTLVELIVVITILAILWTIWFVSFSSHLVWTRDTNRLSQLSAIHSGLEVYSTDNILPHPDNSVEVRASWSLVWYQWFMWKNNLSMISYNQSWKDPKDDVYFTYYVTEDKKHFQLMAYLEDEGNKQVTHNFNFLPNVYAANYSKRSPTVFWHKLWVLTESWTNISIQDIKSISQSWYLDVVNTTNNFIAYLSDSKSVSWTWLKLVQWAISESLSREYNSCKDILDKNPIVKWADWMYWINPSRSNIEVYCDMTNFWKTIIKTNSNSNFLNEYRNCKNITIFEDGMIESLKKIKNDYTTITIDSDITFNLQADDSTNNSYLDTLKISDLSDFRITMWAWSDNTVLNLNTTKDKIYCDSYSPTWNNCWKTNKPAYQNYSDSLIIMKGYFNPNCEWSSAINNDWVRNRFSFKYTYYNLIFSN